LYQIIFNMRSKFYNLHIDFYSSSEIISSITNDLTQNITKSVFFINAYCFNTSQNNTIYAKAINNSDYILNDGIGIKIAGIINGTKFKENLNGTDLIPQIIKIAHIHGKSIYLLGSTEFIINKTKANIEKEFQGIKIVGVHNGFFNENEEENLVNEINTLKPDILIVGMGVPKQELFIDRNKSKLNQVKVCIAGGAIIDFISGDIKRAPLWIRKINFEWAYRLYLEPKRMWRRYIVGNFMFFYYILKLKITK
jgi:N-acetylglucosaminyldiphosphoundecaprenol N-acetyl-beta-D-mannosaminyltransferase